MTQKITPKPLEKIVSAGKLGLVSLLTAGVMLSACGPSYPEGSTRIHDQLPCNSYTIVRLVQEKFNDPNIIGVEGHWGFNRIPTENLLCDVYQTRGSDGKLLELVVSPPDYPLSDLANHPVYR